MEEKKEDGSESKDGCGIRCCCCCCKTIKAVVVLLVGGVLGFLLGRCCGKHDMMCAAPAAASAPAESAPAPAAKPAPKAPHKKTK